MDQGSDRKFGASKYIIDHIILPPKLPQAREKDRAALEVHLLEFVLQIFREFVSQVASEDAAAWSFLVRMLEALVLVETTGTNQSVQIERSISSMKPGDTVILFVKAQNAGLLVHRQSLNAVLIEAFEASPLSRVVNETLGRLDREFPGLRVAVPWEKLMEGDFLHELCIYIEKLYFQEPPKAAKENLGITTETWDSQDPFLVIEYLIDILTVKGERQNPLKFRKHTRDHALCLETKKPEDVWRRSPLWLVLRVALQRGLQWSFPHDLTHSKYKSFTLYLVAAIGSLAIEDGFPPEVLDIIRKKLACREYKFAANEHKLPDFVQTGTINMIQSLSAHLEETWRNEQQAYSTPLPCLNDIPVQAEDRFLPLTRSMLILQDRVNYVPQNHESKPFEPDKGGEQLISSKYPELRLEGDDKTRLLSLADHEEWIVNHFDEWANKSSREPMDYQQILTNMKRYLGAALELYEDCPRELSAVILGLGEMWAVIDRMCVKRMAELGSFHPEISVDFFEPLLLPGLQQLKRLQKLEKYLEMRHRNATSGNIGPFSDPQQGSLAVQYYDKRTTLKPIKRDIETKFREDRDKKKLEWRDKRQEQERRRSEANTLSHDHIEGKNTIHDSECQKCRKENEASRMRITPIRNPLPDDPNQLKTIIFECNCPPEFSIWRDATWLLLHTLGREEKAGSSDTKPGYRLYLHDHKAFKSLFDPQRSKRRIKLAASNRESTHSIAIPAVFSKLCVQSKPDFRLFDHIHECWISDQKNSPSLKSLCNFKLSNGPYESLQWALEATAHSSNEVCARKDHHDQNIQPNEFMALGHIRSGNKLQLLNILVELGSCHLSFEQEPLSLVIFQAIWEAGRSDQDGNVLREAHQQFSDPSFSLAVLKMLKHMMTTIHTSYKRQQSMLVVIITLQRVLSMAERFREISAEAVQLIRTARQMTLQWCRRLKNRIDDKSEAKKHGGDELLLHTAALLCCITFDVEERLLDDILNDKDDSVAVLTEACVLASVYKPEADYRSINARQLRLWCLRSLHRLQPRLQKLLQECPSSFNRVISSYVAKGSTNLKWMIFGQPGVKGRKGRWAQTGSSPSAQQILASQTILYDLIFGELFVDGMQVGKVPQQYAASPLFQRVFGVGVVNAVKSDRPGMHCKLAKTIEENEFHLCLRENNLIIRAENRDGIFEILSPEIFEGDIPDDLLQNHMHWLNLESRTVEFRPLYNAWRPCSQNWSLTFSEGTSATMRCGNKILLSPTSSQATAIKQILTKLEDSDKIHLELVDGELVQASLPRYDLCFFVNQDGKLQSEHLNAEIDLDQNTGTFYGLNNRLVIRDPRFRDLSSSRSILVPIGKITATRTREHINISIHAPPHEQRRRYHCYPIEKNLGILKSADNFSTFYQAYIHALTSFVIPDPLTGYTGVEMALRLLRKQLLRTTHPLDMETSQMMDLVAQLSPQRRLLNQGVEHVKWDDNLSQLSQHEEFLSAASRIYNHTQKHSLYHPQGPSQEVITPLEIPAIHKRAANYNARIQSYEFGGYILNHHHDHLYRGRDKEEYRNKKRAHCVFETAMLFEKPPSRLKTLQDFPDMVRRWHSLAGFNESFCLYDLQDLLALDWGSSWGSLYDLCRFQQKPRAHLQFLFCAIAIGKHQTWNEDGNIVRSFLAIATSKFLKTLSPPPEPSAYRIDLGFSSTVDQLTHYLMQNYNGQGFPETPLGYKGRPLAKWREREENMRDQNVRKLATMMHEQWPAEDLPVPDVDYWTYLNKDKAIRHCKELWRNWQFNNRLLAFLEQVNEGLMSVWTPTYDCPSITERMADGIQDSEKPPRESKRLSLPTLENVLSREDGKDIEFWSNERPRLINSNNRSRGRKYPKLEQVVQHLQAHTDDIGKKYATNLSISYEHFKDQPVIELRKRSILKEDVLLEDMDQFRENFGDLFGKIARTLRPKVGHLIALELAGLMPRLTVVAIFELLVSNDASIRAMKRWKDLFIVLATALKDLQYCERLWRLNAVGDQPKIIEETQNLGIDPELYERYPQWLLLELEGDFTIREEQGNIARELFNRCSARGLQNTVLQFPMGQGKTSVIMPMVVAVLADGIRLVRVVVLRPLRQQMLAQLRTSFGGLLNRKIYHVPISRSSRLDEVSVNDLDGFYKKCMADRGIVVTIPDEILSFKLLTYDLQICPNTSMGRSLIQLEQWLERNASDVLDESDEILDPRFQLIYPRGAPNLLDDSSDRWFFLQGILSRVKHHADSLQKKFPTSVEVVRKGAGFPMINVFGADAGDQLLKWLMDDTMEGRTGNQRIPDRFRATVEEFVYAPNSMLGEQICMATESLSNSAIVAILLLRGLISHGVLLFALQMRWSVEYGLDLTRCNMAVPFVAKNTPSESSEHAHADLRILLTYLSYYCDGLAYSQMEETLKHPDAAGHFPDWLKDPKTRWRFPALESIDFDDHESRKMLMKDLKYNESTINFFLRNVVFPSEGKYFPQRLAASGWDIPASGGSWPTIGFSGTNENRDLLPMNVEQKDLQKLAFTNAADMNKILEPEIWSYSILQDEHERRMSSEGLLTKISEMCSQGGGFIQVLIDVGAFILDLQNNEVASQWLSKIPSSDAEAAVFYNRHHEPQVVDRSGAVRAFHLSPSRNRLERCIVYLDEAHTRGVDLRFRSGTRAAVILGPRLVTDRLLQACMRMRRLGSGHDVVFFAPPAVNESILETNGKTRGELVTAVDLIKWSISNTLLKLKTAQVPRIVQGLQFSRRYDLWKRYLSDDHAQTGQDFASARQLLLDIQDTEDQSLRAMYGDQTQKETMLRGLIDHDTDDPMKQQLIESFVRLQNQKDSHVHLGEQQERETAHEVQRELHVERPPVFEPCDHLISHGLQEFIDTGVIGSFLGFIPAFDIFQHKSVAGPYSEASRTWRTPEGDHLFATVDFARCVELHDDMYSDWYQRQPRWILTSHGNPTVAVIMSPYEPQKLWNTIKQSSKVTLHLYSARTTISMASFSHLDVYTLGAPVGAHRIPFSLLCDINLFAGALYIDSYHEYINLCHYLGIATSVLPPTFNGEPIGEVCEFVPPERRALISWPIECPFTSNVLPFLKYVLSVRHSGADISETDMGMLVDGRPVPPERFDEREGKPDILQLLQSDNFEFNHSASSGDTDAERPRKRRKPNTTDNNDVPVVSFEGQTKAESQGPLSMPTEGYDDDMKNDDDITMEGMAGMAEVAGHDNSGTVEEGDLE